MDFEVQNPNLNPYDEANFLSKIFFTWLMPLFRKGATSKLEVADLYDPSEKDRSSQLGDQLQCMWNECLEKSKLKGTKPNFMFTLIKTHVNKYAALVLPSFLTECIFRIVQCIFLRELLRSVILGENSESSYQYLLAMGVTCSSFLVSIGTTISLQWLDRIALQCRASTCSLIYRKALRLSKTGQGRTTVGKITNHLTNDVNRFDFTLMFPLYLIFGPIQMLMFSYFLWMDFGVSAFAGIAVVILLSPLQYWNGSLSGKYRKKISQKIDERSGLVNQIITAIRVIKMYAWEKPFSDVVNEIRRLEVKTIKKRATLRSVFLSISTSASKMVPLVTLMTYIFCGGTLSGDKVFFCVAAFNIIVQTSNFTLPKLWAASKELNVSLTRIQKFLLLEEIEKPVLNANTDHLVPKIKIDNGSVGWIDGETILNDINIDVSGNKVVIIIGPVGCGKTTLLNTILGELNLSSGTIAVDGSVSYASQESWVFGGSIRTNILFGLPFDKQRYETVVASAALEDDFKQLSHGDMTIVGDRGISLSGGQKARVNLARAMYQKANIYLLDDPLSSVDSKVGQHIFQKCIKEHLEGSLRVLVTHQLQYLPQADHIVVLSNGKVITQGSYMKIVEEGIDFAKFVPKEINENESGKDTNLKPTEVTETVVNRIMIGNPKVSQETAAVGSVGYQVYWDYLKTAKSKGLLILTGFFFITTQLAITGSDYCLSVWANVNRNQTINHEENTFDYFFYMHLYVGLVMVMFFGNFERTMSFFDYCMKISINMHNWMFSSLVRAPSSFFDTNPAGQILNRFTKDLETMDELLPLTLYDMITIFLLSGSNVILVIVLKKFMIIPGLLLFIAMAFLRKYFITTSRAVKRIDSITKSPLLTHCRASFEGLTTIRAAGAEKILTQQFDGYQDINSSAWFLLICSTRWFTLWIEIFTVIFLGVVTITFSYFQEDQTAGSIGLAISSAMSLAGMIQWGLRQSTETENAMIAVERILEYANIKPEAPLESTKENKPPKDWPTKGELRFENVFLSYKDDKDVLKNLSFEVKDQEKIGVVGRTGAGKSSIIQALFRLTEPRGSIYIDGVRINDIGVYDLRKKISIIPQDPVLFCGTMRYNLDPLNEYNDENLWKVLQEVELKESIPALDYNVSDGGSNFSVGQRQLVCLARAILRSNRIIVLDEITAHADPRTDELVQTTIRKKFADCTIITIAHRIQSVIDCDRILVLDKGCLKEYGHPHILLKNENGDFSSIVKNSGRANVDFIKRIASEAYHGKRRSYQLYLQFLAENQQS